MRRASDGHEALVGRVVERFLERHPAFTANPLGDWQELVGEKMARYCQPLSLKKKVLTVKVHDSVWKYHLELLKTPLLAKINKGRPEPLVEKMVIRIGELSAASPPLKSALPKPGKVGSVKARRLPRKKAPVRPLTSEEKDLLKSLSDPDLRATATRLLKRLPLEQEGEA